MTTLSRTSDQPRKPRLRKCAVKACREPFQPRSISHRFCRPECAEVLAQEAREKAQRKKDKARLIELKPRKWWLAKAKKALHAFIRARDEGGECISCDTILRNTGKPGGDYDAGHFRSVGSAKHLEFVEANIFGQCKHCNDYLKGNQLEYERRLRLREGEEFVDALKADQAPRHLAIADFQQIEATYKLKLKQLRS